MTYVCANCATQFPSATVVESYGLLLYRSDLSGRPALADIFSDPAFKELSELTQALFAAQLDDRRLGALAQFLFGDMADACSDGSPYRPDRSPLCPVCGRSQMAEWWEDDPPSFVDVDLPSLAFENWKRRSDEEKREALAAAARGF